MTTDARDIILREVLKTLSPEAIANINAAMATARHDAFEMERRMNREHSEGLGYTFIAALIVCMFAYIAENRGRRIKATAECVTVAACVFGMFKLVGWVVGWAFAYLLGLYQA